MSTTKKTAPGRVRRFRSITIRLVVILSLLAAAGAGVATAVARAVDRANTVRVDAMIAPYVDATLTPFYSFQDPSVMPADEVILSFVVADSGEGCTPSWGTHYSLDSAGGDLDLDRRIVRLRQTGRDVVVSFGGALNDELAVTCDDVDKLTDAYRAVIERYGLSVVDFDIEGSAIGNAAADIRRAEAVKRLQEEATANGGRLEVWLTLPVAPSGLPEWSVGVVDTMLATGVDLGGVNAMTMNYAGSRGELTMAEANQNALDATWRQLSSAYQRADIAISDADVWRKVGATPMIGQNDVRSDVFTLEDAAALVEFAKERGLGRISLWSINRDGPCGAQLDAGVAQNICSGVDQEPLAFMEVLSDLPARDRDTATTESPAVAEADPVDDPATSPYPIWRARRVYQAGDKVVWHRNVYEAKWYTDGDLPDEPVVNVWDTPWRYVGPVLPGESPEPVNFPDPVEQGSNEAWDPDTAYDTGAVVFHRGYLFEASWWNLGDAPQVDPDQPWDSPWELMP